MIYFPALVVSEKSYAHLKLRTINYFLVSDLISALANCFPFHWFRRRLSSSAVMSSLAIKKVLISDKVDASCKDILLKNGIEVDLKPGRSVDELKADIKVSCALSVTSI